MNTPAINRTAALALAAAKRNVDTPKDVAKSPSWKAPEKQQGGEARTLIEKGLASVSNRGTLPSVVQSYVDQMRGKTTLQAPSVPSKANGKVSEAALRMVNLIPSVIAWELNKIADHLTEKMMLSSDESPLKERKSSLNEKNPARETKLEKIPTTQTISVPRSSLGSSDVP